MQIWDPRIEEMPEPDLKRLQFKLLKTLVYRVYSFSPFYHKRMKDAGVHPDDITCIEDIVKLPFMTKKDLRDTYPDGLIVSDPEELVRYHVSSGTTGKPTVVAYTEKDIYNWTESIARGLTSVGIGRGDVMQVSYGYGLFTGGLGLHYGAERVGATVVPASVGNTERQIELMQDLRVTAISCTPSYLLHMGEVAEKMGISIKNDTLLRKAIVGAEPWSEQMRIRIKDRLGVDAYDIYGTSELSGPLFCECVHQNGIHLWGDLIYPEILDPETHESLPNGEKGELVVTMLQKEGLPIIRYMTGDITAIRDENCPCGRTHIKIERISGRVDDMLIIRGINVFPSQVEHALMGIPEISEQFMIEVDRKGSLDEMVVRVELNREAFSDKIPDLMRIRNHVEKVLRNALNIQVQVEFAESGALPRFEGKAKRVIDRRMI